MTTAFEMIVAIYVRNRNSKAIRESLAHRRKLSNDLKSIPSENHLALLTELAQEVALLEAALTNIGESAEEVSNLTPQAPAGNDPQLAEPERTAAEAGQQITETPASAKQVQILVVDISKSTPGPSPVPTPEPLPHGTAPVHIVGLTITAASEADDQCAANGAARRPNDSSD